MLRLTHLAVAAVVSLPLLAGARAQTPIVNSASGLVLDANAIDVFRNDCRVQLWQDFSEVMQNQQWSLEPIYGDDGLFEPLRSSSGNPIFVIRNAQSGLALSAHLPDVFQNDCRILLWEYVGLPNQQWELIYVDGGVKFRNVMSGKLLTAHLFQVGQNGCQMQLWDDLNLPNQIWRIRMEG